MKYYLALIAALGLMACMSKNDSPTQTTATELQSGQIQLVQGLSTAYTSASTDSSSSYIFNLDTAKSSIENEFILQNTGDYDVKNIKLTTNNSAFYFSPSEIPVLPSSKKSLIIQVIKLKVVHGIFLDGVGPTDLLPMGLNTATAKIAATTTNSRHDSITLSQSAQLKVFAKVMDISAFSDSLPIDLFHPAGTVGGTPYPAGSVPYYTPKGACKIVNSGNVNVTIREWNNGQTAILDSAILRPGDAFFPTVHSASTSHGSLELDGKGVISNSSKFRRTADERIFLTFR